MSVTYLSTKDLCARFRCSSRTLFRRMQRKVNPLPLPVIAHAGSFNLWDASEIADWEAAERDRTRACQRVAASSVFAVGEQP